LRGTAGKAGWFDELHPSSAAAARMAKKLAKELN
jgi:lysophospholipase L1-like esterase